MRWLRLLPIEMYALLLPGLILFVIALLADPAFFVVYAHQVVPLASAYMAEGNDFFMYFLGVLELYVLAKVALAFIKIGRPTMDMFGLMPIACSMLAIVGVIALISFLYFTLLQFIFYHSDPIHIAKWSAFYMQSDYALFHTYPPFAVQFVSQWPLLEWLSVMAYLSCGTIFSLALVGLLCMDQQRLRGSMLSFFLAMAMGLPFWFFFPALSPEEMYVRNTLHQPHPEVASNFRPSPFLAPYLRALDTFWIDSSGKSFAVSTFPSMHAAWAVVIVIFLWGANKYLGALSALWALFNLIGALYTLQHYAVDLIAGIAVGALAAFVAQKLLAFEGGYTNAGGAWYFALFKAFERDIRLVKSFLS